MIIKNIFTFLIPLTVIYAVYIQLNGEVSPGGGFQAGVIFATALIAMDIVKLINTQKLTLNHMISAATLGVIIYLSTGLVSLYNNVEYLNYHVLSRNSCNAQQLGIFIVELGVCITVSSVMFLIYICFKYFDDE